MGVNEEDVVNIMGGMEHAGGIKLNDHKRKLKNRWVATKSGIRMSMYQTLVLY